MAGNFIDRQPPGAALRMWVGAVMLQGLAWIVSIMVYAIYWQRPMISTLPSSPTRPGMYVSVGPTCKLTASHHVPWMTVRSLTNDRKGILLRG